MIYFATCGRGFEKFVQEEIFKLPSIKDVLHIAEGKLIFSLCGCENCDICCKKQTFRDIVANDSTRNMFYQMFDFKFKTKALLVSEFESILQLKLVEKVYLLLLYQPMPPDQHIMENITVAEFMDLIDKINFSHCLTMANFLQVIKKKQPKWQMCIDPTTCHASLSRQMEKQQRWKRTKGIDDLCSLKGNIALTGPLHYTQESQELELEKRLLNAFGADNKLSVQNNVAHLSVLPIESEVATEFSNEVLLTQPSFRVSCRIRGLWKKHFKPNILTRSLLSFLKKKEIGDWNEENPLLDIYVNLNDEQILIGTSLSSKPLSLRTYIPHITLRSTVCNLMIRFASIGEGETLLDPMCGAGTILLEAFMIRKNLRIIASDQNAFQLKVARCNLRGIKAAEYLMADAEHIPLNDQSVDTIICDFPFGKKYTTKKPLDNLLVNVLKECIRVVKINQRIVFLLSKDQMCFIEQFIKDKDLASKWGVRSLSQHPISLGLTPAFICVFCKIILITETNSTLLSINLG